MSESSLFNKIAMSALTPMMQQYMAIKSEHQEYLLFYRMGDFYELFLDDAIAASEALDIVLTKRGKNLDIDIPMCGVPVHSATMYLHKLIESGYKVAICDQMETPEEAKKRGYKALVKREVTRIITPGTLFEDNLLEAKSLNFLCAISFADGKLGVAWVDVSTGEFLVSTSTTAALGPDLARFKPHEIIISERLYQEPEIYKVLSDYKRFVSPRAHSMFDFARCEGKLKDYYKVLAIEGIANLLESEIIACGSLIEYLSHTQKDIMPRLGRPKRIATHNFMSIDPATRRNLELVESIHGNKQSTLLYNIDKTVTSSGARLLNLYLSAPLANAQAINKRLDNVEFFCEAF